MYPERDPTETRAMPSPAFLTRFEGTGVHKSVDAA